MGTVAAFLAAWGALVAATGHAAGQTVVMTNLVALYGAHVPTQAQLAAYANAYINLRQTRNAYAAQIVIMNANLAAAVAGGVAGAAGNLAAAVLNRNDMTATLVAAAALGNMYAGAGTFPP